MRNYLSMGFGVNSVALYLLLLEQGLTPGDPVNGFEAVFVNHGTDWPETYEYAETFMEKYPVTVIRPLVRDCDGNEYNTLIGYYEGKRIFPMAMSRQCTHKFKMRPLLKYREAPFFELIGIDADESYRARPAVDRGAESRWPLLEQDPPITREGCKALICRHGLPVPPKSGCYICPFQGRAEFKRLRREHPELFCRARRLEEAANEKRAENGRPPIYMRGDMPLPQLVDEDHYALPGFEAPPCTCAL